MLTIDTTGGGANSSSIPQDVTNSSRIGNANGLDLNDLRKNKTHYLDQATNQLLRKMYTKQFPDIISTILRLKHSKKINDIDCKRLVENINGRFLRTVI